MALGALLSAYAIVQPHGVADSIMTPAPAKAVAADVAKPGMAAQRASTQATTLVSDSGDDRSPDLDLPVPGRVQDGTELAKTANPDIPNNKTLNESGNLVQPVPPTEFNGPADPEVAVQEAN